MKTDWELQVLWAARMIRQLADKKADPDGLLEPHELFNVSMSLARTEGELEQLIHESTPEDRESERVRPIL